MSNSYLFLHHHHLLWYHYPHSFSSWYRTVCMHYVIPKLIFHWVISESFTSNISQSSSGPLVVILKSFPPVTCITPLTYWIVRGCYTSLLNLIPPPLVDPWAGLPLLSLPSSLSTGPIPLHFWGPPFSNPLSFFSQYRTVCKHYPILKLIFDWVISTSFTSNIFQSSSGPLVVISKRFPTMTCITPLTYWIVRDCCSSLSGYNGLGY